MRRSRLEEKGAVYVQTSLRKRNMSKYSLNIRAGADLLDIKEGDIKDNIESAESSTLSEDGRTSMINHVKVIAFLCSIYHMYFRNIAE